MMLVVRFTDRSFWENDLREFLTRRSQLRFEETDPLDEDPLLTTSVENLCDQFVDQ